MDSEANESVESECRDKVFNEIGREVLKAALISTVTVLVKILSESLTPKRESDYEDFSD